jgi:SRSO17 transposase
LSCIFFVFRNGKQKNDFLKNTKSNFYEIFQVTSEGDLCAYLIDYQQHFKLTTTNLFEKAHQYLRGLFSVERSKRNIERMVEKTKSNYQSQQQFLADSPWDAKKLMLDIAKKVNTDLGDFKLQSLNIDENSTQKSGKNSVGVSKQYNGNLGKLENSQTGVFATLGKGELVCQVNVKLYLPKEWIEDEERCIKAGIPKSEIVQKTKLDLALDLIKELDTCGVQYGWIGADSLYGQSYEFADQIDKMGKKFVLDIKRNQHVYTDQPTIKTEQKGKKTSFQVTNKVEPMRVEKLYEEIDYKTFTYVAWRKGAKGWLKAMFKVIKVWVWDKESENAKERLLIIRKDKNNLKFSLTNFTEEQVSLEELAYMQGQRYWIERCFQENISELGMTDYQVRKYNAWYHHMALVMLAMHFILRKRMKYKEDIPLLSTRDIRLQLMEFLVNQGNKIEDEVLHMMYRHKQRIQDIQRHYKSKTNNFLDTD